MEMDFTKILFKKTYPTFKVALLETAGQTTINMTYFKELGIQQVFFVMACPPWRTPYKYGFGGKWWRK